MEGRLQQSVGSAGSTQLTAQARLVVVCDNVWNSNYGANMGMAGLPRRRGDVGVVGH